MVKDWNDEDDKFFLIGPEHIESTTIQSEVSNIWPIRDHDIETTIHLQVKVVRQGHFFWKFLTIWTTLKAREGQADETNSDIKEYKRWIE